MTRLMLNPSWGTDIFRRHVRGRGNAVVKTLEFSRGSVVTLRGKELEAVAGDIGKAVVEVAMDGKHPRCRPAAGVVAGVTESAVEE